MKTEKKLIEQIRRSAHLGKSIVTGIGDDCAVLRLPLGHELLVTTDFTLENVHFRRSWHTPELVGRRCLTRGLSDIAAMGGEPQAAFLSLAVASDVPQKWVDRFLKGLLGLAREFKVPLAGGDTAQSPARHSGGYRGRWLSAKGAVHTAIGSKTRRLPLCNWRARGRGGGTRAARSG